MPSNQFCLGTGRYTVQIRRAKSCGGGIVTEIDDKDIISGTWNRLINATSGSQITIPISSSSVCCEFSDLGDGLPIYEYWLWRKSPSKHHIVWNGVLTDVHIESNDILSLEASDFSWHVNHLPSSLQSYAATDISLIAHAIGDAALLINNYFDIDIMSELSGIIGSKDLTVGDGTKPLSAIIDVLRQVVYWTQVRRTMRINLQGHCGWTFTDEDLSEKPELSWSVEDFATEVLARSSTDVFARAGGADTSRFGCPVWIQKIIDVNAETEAEALSFANAKLLDMNTTGPSIDALQSSISPSCGVDLDYLWPGMKADILFEGYCRTIYRSLYITQVEGAWNEAEEDIRIELSPTIGDPNDPRVAAA